MTACVPLQDGSEAGTERQTQLDATHRWKPQVQVVWLEWGARSREQAGHSRRCGAEATKLQSDRRGKSQVIVPATTETVHPGKPRGEWVCKLGHRMCQLVSEGTELALPECGTAGPAPAHSAHTGWD